MHIYTKPDKKRKVYSISQQLQGFYYEDNNLNSLYSPQSLPVDMPRDWAYLWCKQTSIKLPRYDTKTSRNWRTLDSIETRLIDIWACLAQIQRVTEGDRRSIDGSDRQSGRNKTLRAVFVETVSPNKGYPLVRRHTTTNRWTSVCAVNHHPRQEKPQLSNVIVRNAPVHGKTDKLSWQLSIIAGLIDRLGHRYDSEQDVWKLQIKNRL